MATAIKPGVSISSPQSRRGFISYAADVYAWLIGLTSSFAAHFIGDLPIGEMLLLASLPVLVMVGARRALRPEFKRIYILMAFWLLGLVTADIYHDTNLVDRMRGTALIVFFGLDIYGLSILIGRNERRKLLLLIGSTIGALAQVKLQPSLAAADYPWKFGYAWGTMSAVILISCFFYSRRRYVAAASCILGICVVNLLLNFRSPVLYLMITLVLVFPIVPERIGTMQILPSGKVFRVAVLVLLAIAAGEAANKAIEFVTQAGYISEEAQAKNETQEKSGNLLLGGRPEFVVGLRAALDSPIIGHGSWAHDYKYFEMLNDMLIESGTQAATSRDPDAEADGLIPGHSHIVTAWVWAGMTGLIFWLYVVWILCKAVTSVSILRPPLAPIYTFILIASFWSIWFSPFAFTSRMAEGIMMVIIADLLERKVSLARPVWRRMGAVNPRRLFDGSTSPAQSR